MSPRLRGASCTVAAICMCAAVGCDWPWKHDMVDQQSLQTATSPRPPAAGTVPLGGELPIDRNVAERALHNPIAGTGPTATGRALYGSYCSPCHGVSGIGNGPVARFFVPPGDLTSIAVQQHSDGWIYATITNGTARMPRQGTELSPHERWEIVNVVRSFGVARP
jgi:S-disulfanyl-L-cysteine oxidoreductase SoxD